MEPYKKILVPVDFSEPSLEAARHAGDLARQLGASLDLLHVIDRRYVELAVGHLVENPREEEMRLHRIAEERLATFKREMNLEDLEASATVRTGVPSDEILEHVQTTAPDLLVMGTHGRTGLRRAVLGSQTEMVVRRVPIPVLVVHAPGGEEGGSV